MTDALDKKPSDDLANVIDNYSEHALSLSVDSLGSLPTMTPDKIAKINERMVEIDRANKTAGRKNTQTTNQLMTLTMLTDSPYRRLRQCLAQIEDRRIAIEQNLYEMKRNEFREAEQIEKGDEESMLKVAYGRHARERTMVYIDGALKELAVFQEAYEEIRKKNNIPENWDEEDAEKDEIRHHVRQAFRQAFRDVSLTGQVSQGNAEYLEQYGIHLMTATYVIKAYVKHQEEEIEKGNLPTINTFYEFLDNCYELFGEEYIKVMKHIGLDKVVRPDLLYKHNVTKN